MIFSSLNKGPVTPSNTHDVLELPYIDLDQHLEMQKVNILLNNEIIK